MTLLIIRLDIAIELPHVDAISKPNTENLFIVAGIENNVVDRVRVPNETLEEIRNSLLGFIIPDFDHVIFTS